MKVKKLTILLIGSLIISGVTVQKSEKALAKTSESMRSVVYNVVADENESKESYSDEELIKLAGNYFTKNNNQKPPIVEIDNTDGDKVTIHIYELVDDGNGEGHTATYAWYYVSRKTGQGEDFFGNQVNLTEGNSEKIAETVSASKVTIGDKTYKFANSKSSNSSERTIEEISESTGEKTKLVKKSTSGRIVTNGKDLYYSVNKDKKGIIYKMDLQTKKSTKIISGKAYSLMGGTDNYLYIGKLDFAEPTQMNITYIYNISTNEIKKSKISYYVSGLQIENNRVLYTEAHSDAWNYRFDVTNEKGKKIFSNKGEAAFLGGGKVYFEQISTKKRKFVVTYFEYDLTKKTKKKISLKTYESNKKKFKDL